MSKFYILCGLLSISVLHAQVGVQTDNPFGTFHVDGSNDNSVTPTISEQENDFVVFPRKSGNALIGIGVSTPKEIIDVRNSGDLDVDITQANGSSGSPFRESVTHHHYISAGTLTTPQDLANNSTLFAFEGLGHNGTSYKLLSSMVFIKETDTTGKILLSTRGYDYSVAIDGNGNLGLDGGGYDESTTVPNRLTVKDGTSDSDGVHPVRFQGIDIATDTDVLTIDASGVVHKIDATQLDFSGLPVFADDTAAASLDSGKLYQTSTGEIRIKM